MISTETTSSLVRLGHALSDPTRTKILITLMNGPSFPSVLAAESEVSRQVISNHLMCLRGCGLVTATKSGVRNEYELADHRLRQALDTLLKLHITSNLNIPCGHNLKKVCF